MVQMILTRGIPASGKTTYAKVWASAAPKRVRINRDDLRFMLYNAYHADHIDEDAVTKLQYAAITAALKAGHSVIVDDTNLNDRFVRKLVAVGHRAGVPVSVMDFPVDLQEALRRNALRDRKVPEDVIRQMHDRFVNRKPVDVEPPNLRPYKGTPGKPKAVIVDIDGTLAKMTTRGPFDWKRVGEDELVENVRDTVNALWEAGFKVIVLSGRDGVCHNETWDWLAIHDVLFDEFWMRAPGDMRPDNIIKAELFDAHIRDDFDVRFVIDDRDQVVQMWRAMGLQCFQVQEGDF